MGNHEHGQPQRVSQGQQQLIEGRGAYGIKPRRGLIQKQHIRVQRQCPGQRRPFDHAARERGRVEIPGLGCQSGQCQLDLRQRFGVRPRQTPMFDQRQGHIFPYAERTEQRPALKQHPHALLQRGARRLIQAQQVLTEQPHLTGTGPDQTHDGTQQHRLARARTTHHAQNLARVEIQIQIVMYHIGTEAIAQAPHFNKALPHHQSISIKNSAATASSRITIKIDCTTLEVVC